MTQPLRSLARRVLTPLRPVAWLALVGLAYLALRLLFAGAVGGAGLFSPAGLGNPVLWLLGLAVMALRLVLLFVAPGVILYQLGSRLLAAVSPAATKPAAGDPDPPPP